MSPGEGYKSVTLRAKAVQKKSREIKGDYFNVVKYSSTSMIALLFVSVSTFMLSLFKVLSPLSFDSDWSKSVSYVFLIWAATYFATTYKQYNTLYLLSTAYLLPLALFHLGMTIPHAFGGFQSYGLENPEFGVWLEMSGWYTVLAFSSIGIGLSLTFKQTENINTLSNKIDPDYVKNIIFINGIGLLLASAVFFILMIKSYGNILSYSRVDFFRGGADTRGLGVFMMVFPSAVLCIVLGAHKKWQKKFSIILAAFAFFFFMLSGYRSAALFPAIVGVVLWTKTGRKVPVIVAASFLVAVIFMISIVGVLRALGPYNKIDSSAVEQSIESASVEDTFRTMGQTGGLLAHVIKLVPEVDPHRYGMSYLEGLRRSIPNVLPKMSESGRQKGKEESMYDTEAISNMVPSDWLTYRIARDKFDRGEGVGFSAIAEPYLNFGVAGVVFFFILLGYLFGQAERRSLIYYPYLLLFLCAMYWPLVRTVRNEFSNFLKPAIFILIILIVWNIALKIMPKK